MRLCCWGFGFFFKAFIIAINLANYKFILLTEEA